MSTVRKVKRRPYLHQVNKFIGFFPDLFYDGAKIMCKVCDKPLMCWDKRDCRIHVNSTLHLNKKHDVPSTTGFMFDLLMMLIACDIPLHVLDKRPFQRFWKKYSPQLALPSRSTLRKNVTVVREEVVNKIKRVLRDAQLWLCVAETMDCKKNSIVNVVVRVLDPLKVTVPLLLASKRLNGYTSAKVTEVVLDALKLFEVSTSQVLLCVTGDTARIPLVGESLQKHCPRMVHVTCKAHALHLVAKTIRKCFPEVDTLITNTKNAILKSPRRLQEFRRQCSSIPELPQPTYTRWGAWLKEAFYYAEHYQQIKDVVLQFDPEQATDVKESQKSFQDTSVETALTTIHDNYKKVHDAIEKLQDSTLSLAESLQIVDEVGQLLHGIDGEKNELVRIRFADVLKEDAGFTRLKQICDGAIPDILSEFKDYFTYACITSVDVERSFSKYENIFSPRRTSLTETTMETYLILDSFYKSFPVCDKDVQATS